MSDFGKFRSELDYKDCYFVLNRVLEVPDFNKEKGKKWSRTYQDEHKLNLVQYNVKRMQD